MQEQSLNSRIPAYKSAFASGELQRTYQDLVGIVQDLRTAFCRTYQGEFTVAAVLHGYIDFTYFYVQNDDLKRRKLKFAVVLNHHKADFELWLLGQTKGVQIAHWKKLKNTKWVNPEAMPVYSVFETPLLLEAPDFDDAKKLFEIIHQRFKALSGEIVEALESCE